MSSASTSNQKNICPNSAAVAKALRKNLENFIHSDECNGEKFAAMFEQNKNHLVGIQHEEKEFLLAEGESKNLGPHGREVLIGLSEERHDKQLKDLEGVALFFVMKLKQDREPKVNSRNANGRNGSGRKYQGGRNQRRYNQVR
ncbi:MAG: hypothetical protein SGILL_004576 [Bacillariaceae sp.]